MKEQGPVRASLVVEHQFRDSLIVQEIRLCHGERRLDFCTRVEWHERQVLLKAAFPVRILADNATYEVQFGALHRSTHRNTSWEQEKFEVAAHRWVDLTEPGYGVSLLNDCKYGHDIKDNTMRISLLRGPENPDPTADLGDHEFTYSLYPHPGDWVGAETVRRAAEVNTPAIAVPGRTDGVRGAALDGECSFASVDGPVILDTIKPADDGDGWIFRSYEPNGARGTSRIAFEPTIDSACEVNAVEEHQGEIALADGAVAFDTQPFRINTIRCRFTSP
jgi:alpha-mannosidase